MKIHISYFVFLLFFSGYSVGQNNSIEFVKEIRLEEYIPNDFSTFWHNQEGCGRFLYSSCLSSMDSFRIMYRKPFSPYLLGRYLYGYVIEIDSVLTKSPLLHDFIENDSIKYIRVLFNVKDYYFSPYEKDIYSFPIPNDVELDIEDGCRIFNQLQNDLLDSTNQAVSVYIALTKIELMELREIVESGTRKDILLSVSDEFTYGCPSNEIIFSYHPFFDGYNLDLLLSKKQVVQSSIVRYRFFYYDLTGEELPYLLGEKENIATLKKFMKDLSFWGNLQP